jgi:hypothetical protein
LVIFLQQQVKMKTTLDTEYRLMKKENTHRFEPEDWAEAMENIGERREKAARE